MTGNEPMGGGAKSVGGFTLIELVITVAVLAILAGIAYPAYQDYVMRARRGEAMTALVEVANLEEQFFGDNNFRYTATLSVLPYPTTSGGGVGYYQLSIPVATTGAYTLRAVAFAGGAQEDDTDCSRFELTSTNIRSSFDSAGGATTGCWRN